MCINRVLPLCDTHPHTKRDREIIFSLKKNYAILNMCLAVIKLLKIYKYIFIKYILKRLLNLNR